MAIQFIMPGKVIMGERALDEAAGLLKELGTKALIVTDRVMTELGNVKILGRFWNGRDFSIPSMTASLANRRIIWWRPEQGFTKQRAATF